MVTPHFFQTTVEIAPEFTVSPNDTRILPAWAGLSGKSLGARLMLQSLKLAKGNLNSRFQKRVRTMALDIMERHRAQSG